MSVSVVYRYNKADVHDHFYTTNAGEIGTTTAGQTGHHGYTSEGEAFTVFNHHHAGLVPVYRYFKADVNDHFYTANGGEIGTTHEGQTGNHGYKCEGILGYVSPNEFPGSVAILRYHQEHHHDHFYTVNPQEIGTTHVGHTGAHGYKFEGVVGYAYPAQHHVKIVYRYFKADVNDHFYTTEPNEIGAGKHGYASEGNAFHIFAHHHHGLVPVYRYWKESVHDHFYTANVGEIGATQAGQTGNHGYTCEGILGYVSPTPFHGGIPVYRYWKESHHDHFYTTNAGEIGATQPGQHGNHGYTCEGILGYVPHH
jgi:hypothetical protein